MFETALATCEESDAPVGSTALATRHENEALLESIDMTPTFSVDLPGGLAASFPMGFYSPAPDVHPSFAGLEFRATSIAPLWQLAQYLTRWFESMNQTLIHGASVQNARQIWVVPVSARSAELVGNFDSWSPAIVERPLSPAQMAVTAVSDIQRWLAVGQDQVATLAGYAPRSVKNWREGMDPYPSTVRRLFDLHALLGSLTQRMGIDSARLWLADSSRGGVRRRDLLTDDVGLRSVISEAATTLFEQPNVLPMHAPDFDEEIVGDVSRQPDLFSGSVRRARRRT
jgi:hypothetical protein